MTDTRVAYVADMLRQVTDRSANVLAVVALAAAAQYDRVIDCPACRGLGRHGALMPCPACFATGRVRWGDVNIVEADEPSSYIGPELAS